MWKNVTRQATNMTFKIFIDEPSVFQKSIPIGPSEFGSVALGQNYLTLLKQKKQTARL
jgi:hypothetical protein